MRAGENGDAAKKRFIVHDFLIGSPILIDRAERTLSLYHKNLKGQIYNLDNPDRANVGPRQISGLVKRLNNSNYSLNNSKVGDQYIYHYLMTDEQRAACRRSPYTDNSFITASDSFTEAIRGMCAWVLDDSGKYAPDALENRDKTLAYCERFLKTVDDRGQPRQPRASVVERLNEAKEAITPPQPASGAKAAEAR